MKTPVQYSITGTNASEIAASIERELRDGRITHGATLPSVRDLASSLRVSPTTVAAAYRTLRLRGLLSGQRRHGTRVSHRPPLLIRPAVTVLPGLRDLANGNPDIALLPGLRNTLARLEFRPRLYGETINRPRLLELARQQFETDKIPANSLAVMGGALDAIERVLQAHLRPGDRVAVEDPGYYEVFDLLRALGLVLEPVSVDDFGLIPDNLERTLKSGVAACILTPRAQNPTSAALDEHRARELRRLFDTSGDVLVIEDDHAGPVAGTPSLTVCHRKKGRWAVVRSVSKSLGPDLRLAVVAGDDTTIARVEGRQNIGAGWVSHILQEVVEVLWSDSVTAELLRTAADRYAERRAALITVLQRHGIAARGRSGLNVWIPVPEEVGVVTSLAAAGWAVRAGERYRLKSPPAVRITIAALQLSEVTKLAADVAQSLRSERRSHSA
jgi:DNA-binding transcriptional MocR family regulator